MTFSEKLASRENIKDLIHQYALNVRKGTGGDNADLFTIDGSFETRQASPVNPDSMQIRQSLVGQDEIREYLIAASKSGVHVCPLIFNLLINVDGDEAQSSCVMETRTWPSGNEVIGEYQDSFRRTKQGWQFQRRIFTIFQSHAS